MILPNSIRESLLEDLEEFLGLVAASPEAELVANQVLEQLEEIADEMDHEDLVLDLEESGELDVPLADGLEDEMSSNQEFKFTGEEIVSLLERLCGIEWVEDEVPDKLDQDDDLL